MVLDIPEATKVMYVKKMPTPSVGNAPLGYLGLTHHQSPLSSFDPNLILPRSLPSTQQPTNAFEMMMESAMSRHRKKFLSSLRLFIIRHYESLVSISMQETHSSVTNSDATNPFLNTFSDKNHAFIQCTTLVAIYLIISQDKTFDCRVFRSRDDSRVLAINFLEERINDNIFSGHDQHNNLTLQILSWICSDVPDRFIDDFQKDSDGRTNNTYAMEFVLWNLVDLNLM